MSLLSLWQVIHLLPEKAKAKSLLWVFALVPVVPYLANVAAIEMAQSSAPNFGGSTEHPVEALVRAAKTDYENLLQRQSRTYEAAYDEYRRRYDMEPPRGFQEWYEFAKAHQSPIIDDFDVIFEKVSPFLSLSGREVAEIMDKARHTSGSDLWACEYTEKTGTTDCSHPYRTVDRHIGALFKASLARIPGGLPDVKFLVNHLDEPRVLLSNTPGRGCSGLCTEFNLSNMPQRSVWDTITKTCMPRQHESQRGTNTFGLPFVTSLASAMDLCQNPEYSSMHGLFMSPASFRLFEGFVPILSTGAPSTMGDILMPSPAYTEAEFAYDEAHDVDWERKRNNLHWTGSTTGGVATADGQWQRFHRQRFVQLAQNLGGAKHWSSGT